MVVNDFNTLILNDSLLDKILISKKAKFAYLVIST
jgi:hypothetical protein